VLIPSSVFAAIAESEILSVGVCGCNGGSSPARAPKWAVSFTSAQGFSASASKERIQKGPSFAYHKGGSCSPGSVIPMGFGRLLLPAQSGSNHPSLLGAALAGPVSRSKMPLPNSGFDGGNCVGPCGHLTKPRFLLQEIGLKDFHEASHVGIRYRSACMTPVATSECRAHASVQDEV